MKSNEQDDSQEHLKKIVRKEIEEIESKKLIPGLIVFITGCIITYLLLT